MRIKNRFGDNPRLVGINKKDLINLDVTLLVIVRDLLKEFKKHICVHPHNMTTEERHGLIQSIIDNLDYALKETFSLVELELMCSINDEELYMRNEDGQLVWQPSKTNKKMFNKAIEIQKQQEDAIKRGLKDLSEIITDLWY
jgi:hypothetical protein